MRKTFILLSILFLFCITGSLSATDIEILVDGSKSMIGFAATGSVQKVLSDFYQAIEECDLSYQSHLFYSYRDGERQRGITSYGKIDDPMALVTADFDGRTTILDVPFAEYSEKSKAVIMITDNVDNSSGSIDSKNFYDRIQNTERMKQLYAIPLLESFRGRPYAGGIPYYSGTRGMMAYFVVYDDDENKAQYRNLGDELIKRDYEVLKFYPITTKEFRFGKPKTSKYESIYFLETDEKLEQYILSFNRSAKLAGAIETGKETAIKFGFSLSSKHDHFYLKKDARVKIDNLLCKIEGMPDIPIKQRYKIDPDRLKNDMNPDGKEQYFTGWIYLTPETTFEEDIAILFKRPKLNISFDVLLEAPEGGLSLTPNTGSKYFSKDEAVLDKIYSKYDLLSVINPHSDKDSNTSKIRLKVRNSIGKDAKSAFVMKAGREGTIVVVLLISLVLLGLIIWLLYNYFSVRSIIVIEDEEDHRVAAHASFIRDQYKIVNKSSVKLIISDSEWEPLGHFSSDNVFTLLPGHIYTLQNKNNSEEIQVHFKYN
ncbi:MAG: hypothetical protein ACOCG6_07775 [Candidatus Cloacimonadaceae bacterium]